MAKRKTKRELSLPLRDIEPRTSVLKPEKFKDYLTLGELQKEVKKDKRWIIRLEKQGRLPEAKRVMWGDRSIRLFSPKQVEEIKEIFSQMRYGKASPFYGKVGKQ